MVSFVSWAQELGLSFIPLFVAIDAVGVLPFIVAILSNLSSEVSRRRSLNYALLTALGIGLGFLAIGRLLFAILGISSGDFLIAGGLLLFILALRDIVTGKFIEVSEAHPGVGIVPIGTPLIVGPATLTTLLVLSSQYALSAVVFALILNLTIAWIIFLQGEKFLAFLGQGGQRAIAKIASLLLAAIAVKMVRQGMLEILIMK